MVRRYLHSTCRGREIVDVLVRDDRVLANISPDQLRSALVGQSVQVAERHGKWLFLQTEASCLAVHLGMTGWFYCLDHWAEEPAHTSVLLRFNPGGLAYSDQRLFGRPSPGQ